MAWISFVTQSCKSLEYCWEWIKSLRELAQKEVMKSLATSCSDETDVILGGGRGHSLWKSEYYKIFLNLFGLLTHHVIPPPFAHTLSLRHSLCCDRSMRPHQSPVHTRTMLFSLQNCELNKHAFAIVSSLRDFTITTTSFSKLPTSILGRLWLPNPGS